jgi:hypothetical protein
MGRISLVSDRDVAKKRSRVKVNKDSFSITKVEEIPIKISPYEHLVKDLMEKLSVGGTYKIENGEISGTTLRGGLVPALKRLKNDSFKLAVVDDVLYVTRVK